MEGSLIEILGKKLQFIEAIAKVIEGIEQVFRTPGRLGRIGATAETRAGPLALLAAIGHIVHKHRHQSIVEGVSGQVINLLGKGRNPLLQHRQHRCVHLLPPKFEGEVGIGGRAGNNRNLAGGMAAIVGRAAIGIAQHLVGRIDAGHRFMAVGVAIRMVLLHQTAIGLLDGGAIGEAIDLQNLVRIGHEQRGASLI